MSKAGYTTELAELVATESLAEHLTSHAFESLTEGNLPWRWVIGSETYEIEEIDEPDDPLILVRRSDAARFRVDVAVSVERLAKVK